MNRVTRTVACGLLLLCGGVSACAATVTVEVASQAGAQATAPQKWLQLFADAGVTSVRVRGANPGDKPELIELGSADRPMPKLVAVLTRGGMLAVPGATFTERDGTRLAEYIARLQADGAAAMTAERGRFDLTREEFESVYDELSRPLGEVDAKSSLLRLITSQRGALRWSIDADARGPLSGATAGADAATLAGLARGTALGALLRGEGLAIVPEKPAGKALLLRVASAHGLKESWPVGHEPQEAPGAVAPVLFQAIEVEIADYSVTEALDAITPRLVHRGEPIPVVWDRFALRREGIDPTKVGAQIALGRMTYKRIVDRLASQARLAAKLRIDENGRPFLWLTR
jgi:hypothetical protein